jgi:hypothetical protein
MKCIIVKNLFFTRINGIIISTGVEEKIHLFFTRKQAPKSTNLMRIALCQVMMEAEDKEDNEDATKDGLKVVKIGQKDNMNTNYEGLTPYLLRRAHTNWDPYDDKINF